MSFEDYKRNLEQYAVSEYGEDIDAVVRIANALCMHRPIDKERLIYILLDKWLTPKVYLNDRFDKLPSRNRVSGGPEKLGSEPPEKAATHESSFPPRDAQVSFRQSTQTDEREGSAYTSFQVEGRRLDFPSDLAELIDVHSGYIRLKKVVPRADWDRINDLAKQYGYTKWNSKDRRWEKP